MLLLPLWPPATTVASNPTGTNMAGVINNNNSMVLTAQLHLQKPSQIQQHLQQNIKLSNNQTNQQQVISHNDEAGPAARIIIPPQQYANRYV